MTVSEKRPTHFVKRGKDVFIASDRGDEFPQLAPAVYVVKYDPMAQIFFLTEQAAMHMPGKTYGNAAARATKILTTFADRENRNTGVLLSGNKGSGKSLLAKLVCASGLELGYPVLLVEQAFAGTAFNEFMNSITQRVIVFIDEFEKKYNDHDKQNGLLSLLDGTGVNNKLFLTTTNDGAVSEFLLSRPERMFYHWRYAKLEEEVLIGYCQDNMNNKDLIPKMRIFWNLSTDMSFDIMQSIVQETNRYPDQSFIDLVYDMNVTFGNATSMNLLVKSIKWGDTELEINDRLLRTDLVQIHEGNAQFTVSTELDSWDEQKAFIKAFGKADTYHYNYALAEAEKTGSIPPEVMEGFDTSFKIYMRLDDRTDTFSTDKGAVFERMVDGRQFRVEMTPARGRSEYDLLNRIFS